MLRVRDARKFHETLISILSPDMCVRPYLLPTILQQQESTASRI